MKLFLIVLLFVEMPVSPPFIAMHVLNIHRHHSHVHRSSTIVVYCTQAKSREMQSRGHAANINPTNEKVAITSSRKDSNTKSKPLFTASRLCMYYLLLSESHTKHGMRCAILRPPNKTYQSKYQIFIGHISPLALVLLP